MASGAYGIGNLPKIFDLLVIGGGNAALCAAMTAREAGADVLLMNAYYAFAEKLGVEIRYGSEVGL
jgi:phytoene dehydrogenase-like protein